MTTNPNFPALSAQCAFNASPGDPTNIPVWVDLTGRVTQVSSAMRGKQYETDQTQAGQANVSLNNPDEALNPAYAGGPYASTINLYRPWSIQAVWPPAGTGNLLSFQDPSFETTTSGVPGDWFSVGVSGLGITTAQAFDGTRSLGVTLSGTASGIQGIRWRELVVPGTQYTWSAYVRQGVANSIRVGVATNFDQPPTTFVATSSPTTTTGAWVRLQVTFTATQPLQQLWVYAQGAVTADTLYIDAIQLEQGTPATTFTTSGARVYSVMRGYVERWPSTWQYAGTYGVTPAVVVDAMAVLAQQELGTEVWNAIQSMSPTYYWALQDDALATAAAESSGNNGPSLQVYTSPAGAGNGLQLGGTSPDLLGDPSGARVTVTPGNNNWASFNITAMDCQMLNAGPAPGSATTPGISPIPANPASPWGATLAGWGSVTPVPDSKALPQLVDSAGTPGFVPITMAQLVCTLAGNATYQAAPLAIGVVGTNLLWNQDPSFENQTTGAGVNNLGTLLTGACTITTAQAEWGSKSATFPISGGSGIQGVLMTGFNLTPGQQYTFSAAVRQTAANTMTVGAAADTNLPPRSWLNGSATILTTTNNWLTVQCTFTATNSQHYLWVYTQAPANTGTCYVDGLHLEVGPTASTFTPLGYAAMATYAGPFGSTLIAVDPSASLADGKMHHLAATVTQDPAANTVVTLYRDGFQVATASGSTSGLGGALPAGATGVQVGGQAVITQTGMSWSGQLAHIAAWNTALSSGSIYTMSYAGTVAYDAEHSGDRARRYITYALPGDLLFTDTGASQMGPGIVTAGTKALQAVQDIATSENGNVYCDSEGRVIFAARTRKYTNTTPKWILGELETPYQGDISFDYDPTLVYNDWLVSRSTGTVVRVADGPSKKANFPRGNTRTLNIHSDAETVDAANFLLNTYKTPQQRVAQISLNPATNPALWPVVLGMEIGDRVTVKRRTAVGLMQADFFIEQIQHDFSVSQDTVAWTTKLQMSPAARYQVWIIGDPTYGVIGSTTKLGY